MSVEEIENWKMKFEQERDARVKAEALLEVKNIELGGLEHTHTKRKEE
ncbi:MAG: hypothetical protein RBT59_01320 [Arcobacteraceae bacterium]|jgi:hypothetical protein|nr:hypothetical protein [Arcobacteraceae bacterium]